MNNLINPSELKIYLDILNVQFFLLKFKVFANLEAVLDIGWMHDFRHQSGHLHKITYFDSQPCIFPNHSRILPNKAKWELGYHLPAGPKRRIKQAITLSHSTPTQTALDIT
jgi:hypothetical protein